MDRRHNRNHRNIEYIGDNVLVLRNIKDNNYPTYLVTVLNAPTDFKASPVSKTWPSSSSTATSPALTSS